MPRRHPRLHYAAYDQWLRTTPSERIERKRAEADLAFHRVGITFAVYGEEAGKERLIPFDIIPRIIPSAEWKALQAGLRQRVRALNMFLVGRLPRPGDPQGRQDPRRAGAQQRPVPPDHAGRRRARRHLRPHRRRRHRAGREGEFYVLEDNLRVPSGVSYMLEDRKMMMRLFPELFARHKVAPVQHHWTCCSRSCARWRRRACRTRPWCSTPGAYNSAYFEHTFLAQQMGVELVEGRDLFVKDEVVLHAHDAGRPAAST